MKKVTLYKVSFATDEYRSKVKYTVLDKTYADYLAAQNLGWYSGRGSVSSFEALEHEGNYYTKIEVVPAASHKEYDQFQLAKEASKKLSPQEVEAIIKFGSPE